MEIDKTLKILDKIWNSCFKDFRGFCCGGIQSQTNDFGEALKTLSSFANRLDEDKIADLIFNKFELGSGRSNDIAHTIINYLLGKNDGKMS